MILSLNGPINEDMFKILVEGVNLFSEKHKDDKEKLLIYMDSSGGDVSVMFAMIDIINNHKSFIELIGNGKLYSAAFFIFYTVKCPRKLLPGTMGMAHLIRATIDIVGNKGYYDSDKALQKWTTIQNKWSMDFFKDLQFTAKEMIIVKKAEELYLQTDRLIEFLDKQK